MVLEAMDLNEITKEESVDRKVKSKDWDLGHSNSKYLGRRRGSPELFVLTFPLLCPYALSLPWLCPILSYWFAGSDFCWPVLSCGHPSLGLTDQFQDWQWASETALANPRPQNPLALFEIHLAPSGLTPAKV